jgi:ketosteroid isomerase-like protein
VQSPYVSRELSNVDRELIEARLSKVLDLCAHGDATGVAEYFTEDVVYVGGTWRVYPLSARREGRKACMEMLRAFYIAYESLGSKVQQVTIDGDRVAVMRMTRFRNRGTGKTADVPICTFLRLRDGLVAEYAEFPDTAAVGTLDD